MKSSLTNELVWKVLNRYRTMLHFFCCVCVSWEWISKKSNVLKIIIDACQIIIKDVRSLFEHSALEFSNWYTKQHYRSDNLNQGILATSIIFISPWSLQRGKKASLLPRIITCTIVHVLPTTKLWHSFNPTKPELASEDLKKN